MNWSLLLSGLALCVSLGTVIYVQRRTDRREMTRWRRDTLSQATLDFLRTINNIDDIHRSYLLTDDESKIYHGTERNEELKLLLDEIKIQLHTYEICGCHELSALTEEFIEETVDNMVKVIELENQQDTQSSTEWKLNKKKLLKEIELSTDFETSVKLALQKAIGLKKDKAYKQVTKENR
jgi:DNA integrity scanning protein DisA with diadenylate cyclase activity